MLTNDLYDFNTFNCLKYLRSFSYFCSIHNPLSEIGYLLSIFTLIESSVSETFFY